MGRVSFNMRAVSGPWGGSSVFVSQLASFLGKRGYQVGYDLKGEYDLIVLVDPRVAKQKPYGPKEIAEYKKRYPGVKVLHRINECDKRKNTDFMDKMLDDANKLADYTVFISEWLRNHHAERWFSKDRAHKVIYNGADPAVFHPISRGGRPEVAPFRIVTHHWSSNELKGFPAYEQVDSLIAEGRISDAELWIIGRWPERIKWKSARTFPPTSGRDLAEKLRACDAYITASLWEPCGMHHVEGAQCGLPLIYHEDGGGIVEAGQRYGIGFGDNVAQAIDRMRNELPAHRDRLLDNMPSGDRMCLEYAEIVQRLICKSEWDKSAS